MNTDVFMDDIEKKAVKNIAGELDCGLDCYYNTKTKEVISIPNEFTNPDFDDHREFFEESIQKLKDNADDIINIEVLKSFESYKIMEGFRDQVRDEQFNQKLTDALNRRQPFQNFKRLIDNSDYRQDWFDFKQEWLENYVREQLGIKGTSKNPDSVAKLFFLACRQAGSQLLRCQNTHLARLNSVFDA